MKPVYRIALSLVILLAFIVLFCFVWLENSAYQVIGLCLVTCYSVFFFGVRKLLRELRILAPFMLFLVAIYGMFALLNIGEGTAYWLHYGITRSALLVSTLLFMQIIIAQIDIDDILNFPLHISKLKYLILGKLLFMEISGSYSQLCVFMQFIPTQQCEKRNLLGRVRKSITVLLALLIFTIREATEKGEMIDARISHCYNARVKTRQKRS